MDVSPLAIASDWLQFASTVLLAIGGYFLKRSLGHVDALEIEVQTLKEKIAVLLDRDRQRRLADYEQENRERHSRS